MWKSLYEGEGRIILKNGFSLLLQAMKKKKKSLEGNESREESLGFDPELLRMYMTGATNPGFSHKFENTPEVVDLHLEKVALNSSKVAPEDALFIQLEAFEKALDQAIAAGKLEMRVVHGLGKGKLKQEIHKILAKHPMVDSFKNDHHSRYGFGSTIITFRF